MAVRTTDPERGDGRRGVAPAHVLEAYATASQALAEGRTLAETLDAIVGAAAVATGSQLALARVLDADGLQLATRSVVTVSRALAAELEGSRVPVDAVDSEEDDGGRGPVAGLDPILRRVAAGAVLRMPVAVGGCVVGALDLARAGKPYAEDERVAARLGAAQIAVALRAFEPHGRGPEGAAALEAAGSALAAATDDVHAADEVVRLAVDASGAEGGVLWRLDPDGGALRAAAAVRTDARSVPPRLRDLAERTLGDAQAVVVAAESDGAVVTLKVGEPPLYALQLRFGDPGSPARETLGVLSVFAARAASALRAGERERTTQVELERARALLAVVTKANAELSVARTLETVIGPVAALLEVDRVDDGRLSTALAVGLPEPQAAVAERLLELALASPPGRAVLAIADAASDPRLEGLGREVAEAAVEAAFAVPLAVPDEVVGLLALFPRRGRTPSADESALLSSLAAQIAVAVQNARLHE
jgi:GAF domain-containing protein